MGFRFVPADLEDLPAELEAFFLAIHDKNLKNTHVAKGYKKLFSHFRPLLGIL